MLKNLTKNNYLKCLVLIALLFASCLSAITTNKVFALQNDEQSDHNQSKTLKASSTTYYELVSEDVNSLKEKVTLGISKTAYELKKQLLQALPSTEQRHLINGYMNKLHEEVLDIDHWEDCQIDNYTKHQYDAEWMKQITQDAITNILKQAVALTKNDPNYSEYSTVYEKITSLNTISSLALNTLRSLWWPAS
ncbi:hypothetical protein [Candidatus Phytoplasma meliae]|uniref:Lipoprotein n=1 Tax=Candidatus Phytoplasma meliae TaxID=1848402 RepID=A0ABS5CYP6_9MOLU|nr:hypothetical protein [Candidatus Phytoplasma meliae]MBP5836102.1 hypothetical protein [Candidatus Phytoplasma meliae]